MEGDYMNESIWQRRNDVRSFPSLENHAKTDVAVIGGGLTGILSAYLLAEDGFKVTLIERDRLMQGTTGYTTAKITAQHGLIYDELIAHIGLEQTKKYFLSQQEAMHFIKRTIDKYQIDCGYKKQDAILYTNSPENSKKLTKEAEAYQKLNIPHRFNNQFPFSIPIEHALIMEDQAEFHPVAFLRVLIDKMAENGVHIYENTSAIDMDHHSDTIVRTDKEYDITAEHVIVASQFPFYEGQAFYSMRMEPSRSYVTGFTTDDEYPGGMYLDIDNPVSLRTLEDNGETIWLLGGESHKVGQYEKEKMNPYEKLKEYGEKYFQVKEWRYQWSAQDYATVDNIPYIGLLNKKYSNVYVATGYRKWGMTNSAVAAKIISDKIAGRENPFAEIYATDRFHPDPAIKNAIKYNSNVTKELIKGKLQKTKEMIDLKTEEATKINEKGQTIGVYKDKNNKLYAVDTTCTHMGCECSWNDAEKTWDCPCHGSRFSYDGSVLEGPAIKNLKIIETEKTN